MSGILPKSNWGCTALGSGIATVTSLSSLCVVTYLQHAHGCRTEKCKPCSRYNSVANLSAFLFPIAAATFVAALAVKVFSLPLISRCSFIPRTWDHFCRLSTVASLGSFVAGAALTLYIDQHGRSCKESGCYRCFFAKKSIYPLLILSAIAYFPFFLSATSKLEKMTLNLSENWVKISLTALAVAALSGAMGLYRMPLATLLFGVSCSMVSLAAVSLEYRAIQSIWNATSFILDQKGRP